MTWPAVYLALLLSHFAGDFLLQTEWQAVNKRSGPGRHFEVRRALALHGVTYTAAYVPALVWLAREIGAAGAVACAAAITIPHLLIDDGRLLSGWMSRVKHNDDPQIWLLAAVDQTFHLICLLPVALVAATA
jgi:uncharacterized membrane protein YdcZ (DUF606 family)